MDRSPAVDTSTRGYERLDPMWHSQIDGAPSVDQVVALTRDYIATITPEQLGRLPERCRPLRVKSDEDIEYWTFRLSQPASPRGGAVDAELMHDLFMHFLHASLRIAQIHKQRAQRAESGDALTDGL